MNASKFIDTNILVYAFDLNAPEKRAIAQRLIEQGWTQLGSHAISVQVLQEFHVNLCRRGVTKSEASRIVQDFVSWPIVDNTISLLKAGLVEQSRWDLSLWDSLILAAARSSGAVELVTEDFNHGQNYGGIRAVNPFR